MNQLMVLRIHPARPFHQFRKAPQPHFTALTIAFQTHGDAHRIQSRTGLMLIRFCASVALVLTVVSAGAESVAARSPWVLDDAADAAEMLTGDEAAVVADMLRTAPGADRSITPARVAATPLLLQLSTIPRLSREFMKSPFQYTHCECIANLGGRFVVSQINLVLVSVGNISLMSGD